MRLYPLCESPVYLLFSVHEPFIPSSVQQPGVLQSEPSLSFQNQRRNLVFTGLGLLELELFDFPLLQQLPDDVFSQFMIGFQGVLPKGELHPLTNLLQ